MDKSRQEEMTDDDTEHLVSHADDNHLPDDNEAAEKAHKMGNSAGLMANETALAYANKRRQPLMMHY